MKILPAILPVYVVFGLTIVVSQATGHPPGLFLSLSTSGIVTRFVLATPVLVAPIAILPRLLSYAAKLVKNNRLLGQFARTRAVPHQEFTVSDDLVLRPFQGMALSLIFAERFLSFLEYSTGTSFASLLLRSTIFAFLMVSPLISLFLSIMWTFDDLGVKQYNKETGEARMLGSSIGVAIPLITGAISVFTMFRRASPIDALIDLVGALMILYPPYVIFVILHHEFVRRRFADLSGRLPFERIEIEVTHLRKRHRA